MFDRDILKGEPAGDTPKELLVLVRAQAALLAAVATGGPAFNDVDPQYQERRKRIRRGLKRLRLEDPFPWRGLWDWYRYYSANVSGYGPRRAYISEISGPLIDELEERAAATGVADFGADVETWPTIEQTAGASTTPQPRHVQEAVRMAIGRIDGTQAEVAAQIGVAESSLSKWQSGKGRASLAGVVRLCAGGQWSVAEFLQGRLTYAPGPSSTRPSPWRGRVRKDWSAIERRARMRATTVPPPTLRQLADALRVDIRGLRKELPDLASDVVRAHQAWAADKAERRLADATAFIEATVQSLVNQGLNPSRRAVEARLPKPFSLREPALQAVWKRARSDG